MEMMLAAMMLKEGQPSYLILGGIALILILVLKTAKKIIKLALGAVILFAIYSSIFGNPLF